MSLKSAAARGEQGDDRQGGGGLQAHGFLPRQVGGSSALDGAAYGRTGWGPVKALAHGFVYIAPRSRLFAAGRARQDAPPLTAVHAGRRNPGTEIRRTRWAEAFSGVTTTRAPITWSSPTG